MYLMYVDESGDVGLVNSPTRYFVLSGLVVHELRWQSYLDQLIGFRRALRDRFGLWMREELHASHLINNPGALNRIKRHDRLAMLRMSADQLSTMSDLNIISIVVDKSNNDQKYDVFDRAWQALIQRFENTLSHHNFRGPANPDERGMIFADHTDDKKLMRLLRRMRRWNPIPSYSGGYYDRVVRTVIEDPNFRESGDSFFIQAADIAAYLVYQNFAPNSYMRRKGGHRYFYRLDPVLCKVASRDNQYGLVVL